MKTALLLSIAALAACGGSGRSSASEGGTLDGGVFTETGGTSCDCAGMALPDECMRCSNGTSDCAHYACNQGKCGIAICE